MCIRDSRCSLEPSGALRSSQLPANLQGSPEQHASWGCGVPQLQAMGSSSPPQGPPWHREFVVVS
eukprot:9944467-Alexandrium_andersonii.AAC.1